MLPFFIPSNVFLTATLLFWTVQGFDDSFTSLMPTEESRDIAQQWFSLVQAGRYDQLDTLATPDANWWVAGLKERIPAAGDMPYKEKQQLLGGLFMEATSCITKLRSQTTEGNTSVLEVVRKAVGPGNKTYESASIVKLIVKDGRVEEVREYTDFFALYEYTAVPWFYTLFPRIVNLFVPLGFSPVYYKTD